MNKSVTKKRDSEVCRKNKCNRFERYGTPPVNNTNYLCLYADAFRLESKEAFEALSVPGDCLFKEQM